MPRGPEDTRVATRPQGVVQWWTGRARIVLDAVVLGASIVFSVVARLDLTIASSVDRGGLAGYLAVTVLAFVAAGWWLVHRGTYRYGSFEEMTGLAVAVGLSSVAGLAHVLLAGSRPVPLSTPVVSAALALVGMAGLRWVGRRTADSLRAPVGANLQPVLVCGAGEGGYQVIRSMLSNPRGGYRPVGLLDDDPAKRNLRLEGVRVLGPTTDLAEAAAGTGATAVVVAVRTPSPELMREVTARASGAGLAVLSVAGLTEHGRLEPRHLDIRRVTVEEVLGRRRVRTDVHEIAMYLTGKRVLVTGAGGSIGQELCRQIATYRPEALIMLDRDESGLHAVQLSIEGRALLDDPNLVLADLRDIVGLEETIASRRPHVVFHAAALKHLPMLQSFPGEAVQTNVWGTLALLEACDAHGVERFVHVSTDKAADPTSVLGYSKRVAERLTASFAGDRAWMSVRFGNVLGSRGSVLETFARQIQDGSPVTVTDVRASRYFMSISEAVELVIQAGAIGGRGDSLVLDMGEPVLIVELAERLAELAGRRIEVVETGLRPGEKVTETLLGQDERGRRPHHPLITHVPVPPLSPLAARELDPWLPDETVVKQLRDLVDAPEPPL